MIGSDGEATPRETRCDDDEDDDKRDENAMLVATMLRIDVEGKPLTLPPFGSLKKFPKFHFRFPNFHSMVNPRTETFISLFVGFLFVVPPPSIRRRRTADVVPRPSFRIRRSASVVPLPSIRVRRSASNLT